jgi:hypothetical protein
MPTSRTSSKASISPPIAACGSVGFGLLTGHPEMGDLAMQGPMRNGSNSPELRQPGTFLRRKRRDLITAIGETIQRSFPI